MTPLKLNFSILGNKSRLTVKQNTV